MKPFKQRLKNTFIYCCILALMRIIKLLPRPASLAIARTLARIGYFFAASERRKIHQNLLLAFGGDLSPQDRHEIGKKSFVNIAQNLVDAVLMRRLLAKRADSIMRIQGLDNAKNAQTKGKGIIFLTAHTGCFEMLSPRFSQLGFPMIVLGAKIYDPRLNDLIIENRKSFNVDYVERGQGLKEIYRMLQHGGCFGVLCDLDTRVESRFINFFGTPAKTVSGPFRMGIKRGIPLIPIFAVRGSDGCQDVLVYPEITPLGNCEDDKVTDAMQKYTSILENLIRRDTAQWIWMHERWKSKP